MKLLVAALATAVVQASPAVYPQQGAIGLAPPPGMAEAAGYTGFEDIATQRSIVLAELPPAAFDEMVRRLDTAPGGRLPNGVTLTGKGEAITVADGTPARLYRGAQTVGGIAYTKWLLLAGGKTATALVTAQAPAATASAAAPGFEAALRSVRLRGAAELETSIAALPFTVGNRAGFRPVRTLMGSGLLLTEGPLDVDTDGAQPLVVVAGSLGAVPVADRADFARKAVEATPELSRLTVLGAAVSSDGSLHTVAATAVDRARTITLRQHIRFLEGGGYIRIVCTSPVAEDIAGRCDRLAQSVTLRPR
ncbi:hypothetical protein OKW76_15700 [Sphingomonas sp. S1-29]|uniref:hypothetical protein n=1 Tax=Sphingomonas sp. S1-29 TaxID=2991074 RepID=UPI00223F3847|nr:hypothetical protein [Sphingomonas sp. S1-29]UZK69431.1 hypothetical protein OKW76_15700 [Sphingomonas sp. S1-29]